MTTMQLNSQKYKLIEEIMSIDSSDLLDKVSKYVSRIKKPTIDSEAKRQATKNELEYLLGTFKSDDITEEDVINEVKQVRRRRYEKRL
jgi:hypothetical protein